MVKDLFQEIDVSKNGVISAWELELSLRDKATVRQALGVPERLAGSLFNQMDTDGNGSITLVEFYRYYTQSALKEPYTSPDGWEKMAANLMQKIDQDRSGNISQSELAAALRCDRSVQLELGWPAHRAQDLYNFLATPSGISLEDLRSFCRLRWLFYKMDENRSDFIDNFEFGRALNNVQMQRELGVPLSQAQQVFREMDRDRSNNVSFETFFRHFKARPAQGPTAGAGSGPPQLQQKFEKPEDKYTQSRKLGEGGFGIVYLVQRKTDGLKLVMKKPKLESGVSMQDVQQEIEMMQRLKHPHIVRLVESYTESSGALIMITEFADGGDLADRLKKFPHGLAGGEVKELFTQVLDAMKYVHSRRVLHRDLKPANILLTEGLSVKVGDLGLATQLKASSFQAALTQCGTPLYMAPEIFQGEKYAYKADMFSLGCILYEMCKGKLCFRTPAAIMNSQLPADLPAWCGQLISSLLSQNPDNRPDADAALKSLSVLDPNGSPPPPMKALPASPGAGHAQPYPPQRPAPPPQAYQPPPMHQPQYQQQMQYGGPQFQPHFRQY